MSMLDPQVDNLRLMARLVRDYDYKEISRVLREAANTIDSLRDRLQDADVAYNDAEVLGDVTQSLFRDLMAADPDTARLWARSWPELFGGPEKAVDSESYGQVPDQGKRENEGERESYGTPYQQLFGTPERAARTLERSCHLLYRLKVDGFAACIGCPAYDEDADVDDCCHDTLLEWLRGDA